MDLLAGLPTDTSPILLGDGATILPGFASQQAEALLAALLAASRQSPFRHLTTRGGKTMSVAMTNCGRLGWISDRRGYRYDPIDPLTGYPWPAIPAVFRTLASHAATAAGYPGLHPDACLINRYAPAAGLTLHQDRDELDLAAPIVSVSLGLPAIFLFGGQSRIDPVRRSRLQSGDVVVWGGPSRLAFHGIAPLKPGHHPLTSDLRYNLTFRCVTAPADDLGL